jgi:dynein heavy chain 1, cytosolic
MVCVCPTFAELLLKPFIGLVLEGASWINDQLVLNQGESARLNPSQVRWVQMDDVDPQATLVNLPVYLNNDRSDVLFTVDLPFDRSAGALVFTRAVCLTASG